MRQLAIAILLGVVLSCGSAWAQDVPRVEVSGGYALLHETDLTMHGFSTGLEVTITRYLGIAADFGMGFKTMTESGISLDTRAYTYLVGPRFDFRSKSVRTFGQVLFGGVHFSAGGDVEGVTVGAGVTGFAWAFDAGLDINLNKMFAIRPVQIGILHSRFTVAGETVSGNDLRYAAGLVLKFGK